MARISTGTGDEGTTGLVGGARVSKASARVAAYGAIDEANDAVGVAAAFVQQEDALRLLRQIQNDLFVAGSDLATPGNVGDGLRIEPEQVAALESETNRLEAALPPLRRFVLPGGTPGAAHLFRARGVVRRAEREAWILAGEEDVNPNLLVYLNRLSDLLFLLARDENRRSGVAEVEWVGKG